MTTPTEEVYVVEHLVNDEMGFWWKPVFTHTNPAVALGKLMDQGAHYHGTREATRMKVYKGTTTVITRSDAAGANEKLLQECRLIGHGRAHADPPHMVAYVTDAWVAIGKDCEPGASEEAVLVNRGRVLLRHLRELENEALPPLEVLNREFEYGSRNDILKAEEALLKLSDLWVPKSSYDKFVVKEKKPVKPLRAVEINRPCRVCSTVDVGAFEEPGDSVCSACREDQP